MGSCISFESNMNRIEDLTELVTDSDDELENSADLKRIRDMWTDLKSHKGGLTEEKRGERERPRISLKKSSPVSVNSSFEASRGTGNTFDRRVPHNVIESTGDKRIRDLEAEVERCHETIAKQAAMTQAQRRELEELRMRAREASERHTSVLHDRDRREDDLVRLREVAAEADARSKRLAASERSLLEKVVKYEDEIERLRSQNSQLHERQTDVQRTLDDMVLAKQSEGASLLEVERMKKDLKRLVELLKSTSEFREFSHFVEDAGGAHFVKTGTRPRKGTKCCAEAEKSSWVPKDAVIVAREWRNRFAGVVSEEDMDKLLVELNKSFAAREATQTARLKQHFQEEINVLKRHIASVQRFDELQARKTISRLRSRLRALETAQENRPRSREVRQNLAETFKSVGNAADRLRHLEAENRLLLEKVQLLESNAKNLPYDRRIYLEGALWIVGKIKKDIGRTRENFAEMVEEYHRKGKAAVAGAGAQREKEVIASLRRQDWLLENFDTLLTLLNERIALLGDSLETKRNPDGESLLRGSTSVGSTVADLRVTD
eukprot:TRINITY_DN2633_c0_g3_i1.p1 TRINITY_DN2633_c0_g3~~TRINITY_DN2633_c0_g3_i1.p1  ORF type:complete len:550 (+),score=153.04 TRINITY_DN2633_c0_g3_i1:95-1744(+)